MKKCPNCGSEYDNSHFYCLNCGMNLVSGGGPTKKPEVVSLNRSNEQKQFVQQHSQEKNLVSDTENNSSESSLDRAINTVSVDSTDKNEVSSEHVSEKADEQILTNEKKLSSAKSDKKSNKISVAALIAVIAGIVVIMIVVLIIFGKKGANKDNDNNYSYNTSEVDTELENERSENEESDYSSITAEDIDDDSTIFNISGDIDEQDSINDDIETTTIIEISPQVGFVITERDALSVRDDSNTNAEIIGEIPKGGEIAIISEVGEWYEIDYFGKTGYVSKSFISFDKNDIPKDTPNDVKKKQGKVITKEDPLNVRKSPSTSSKILGTVPKDGTVSITDESGDWYVIEYNGEVGYVSKQYIAINDED